MPDHLLDAHVELRNRYPIAWVARLINEPAADGALEPATPALVVSRFDLEATTPEAVEETAQFYTPPTAGDGFQLVDPRTNERVAFLTVAHLKPQVDPQRPLLMLQTIAVSAFTQPDWPFVFGSYNPADPMAGVWVSLNTPRHVRLGWIEGALLHGGELTVEDILGGPTP